MIPVYVLSEPTLAISVGHRPANSRPAVPTREYEPGSGESHDPAPVHRPHPPRSPPPHRAVPGGQADDRRPPLRPQGCLASRFARRPAAALDPGASAAAVAGQSGRPRACPYSAACPPGTPGRSSRLLAANGRGSDRHALPATIRNAHQTTNHDKHPLGPGAKT